MGDRGPKKKVGQLIACRPEDLKKPSRRLTGAASEVWDEEIEALCDRGVIQPGDEPLFAAYCFAVAELYKGFEKAKKAKHPDHVAEALKRIENAEKRVDRLCAHFGIGQKARASLGIIAAAGVTNTGKDKAEEFDLD